MSVLSDVVAWFGESANWQGDDGVPNRLVEHLGYTALSVGIAAAIAVPLGLWIGHTGRFKVAAVVSSGVLRALPTLGVLTFASLYTGIGIKAAIVTLVILAIPPILAGAYAGLEAVDRATIDAARAMGMTQWQILFRVEIPLALALIIGGFRSATLQVVATATVAAYIPGPGGLGRYLIDGLAVRDFTRIVAGAVVVIALALVLDACFALAHRLAVRHRMEPARASA
jgi:osmoprotectant transport system permease protein